MPPENEINTKDNWYEWKNRIFYQLEELTQNSKDREKKLEQMKCCPNPKKLTDINEARLMLKNLRNLK